MNVSSRGQDIQASPNRKLKPYADAAKAKGIKVIHLNIGDPDIRQISLPRLWATACQSI